MFRNHYMPGQSGDQDLDLSLLLEIADGSTEFIVESINLFMQQTPESLQQLTESLDVKDFTMAASSAHKLKSTLGFFGMLNSQALILQIEQACKNVEPDLEEILSKLILVKANIAQNSEELQKLKLQKQEDI